VIPVSLVRFRNAAPGPVCPSTPQHGGLQRDKVTHHGTEKNRLLSRELPASGPFPQRVAGVGSNHRRLSRRFYSPLAPPESLAADQRGRRPRCDFGPPPSAMCPWAGSQRRGDARTGTDGGVERPRLHPRSGPFWPLTCSVQDAISPSPSSSPPGSGSVSLAPRASAMRWLAASACPSMCANRS
jgi:hypothetical protein